MDYAITQLFYLSSLIDLPDPLLPEQPCGAPEGLDDEITLKNHIDYKRAEVPDKSADSTEWY